MGSRTLSVRPIDQDLQASEDPMYPDCKQIIEGGTFRVGIPSTVFTAFMVSYLNTMKRSKTQLTALILAVVLQVSISLYLHEAVTDVEGDLSPTCDDTSLVLQSMTLVVFVMSWLNDMIETIHMCMWLSLMRVESPGEQLVTQEMKDMKHILPLRHTDAIHEGSAKASGGMQDDGTEAVKVIRPRSSISWWAKTCFYTLGIWPKVLVSFLVLICGAGAILRAGSQFDMVLNTVAASFLMEIDDVMYKVLFSTRSKFSCSGVPELGWTKQETHSSILYWVVEHMRPWFSVLVAIGLVAALRWGYWCTSVAPDTPITWYIKNLGVVNDTNATEALFYEV